jgi:hypothetical protein
MGAVEHFERLVRRANSARLTLLRFSQPSSHVVPSRMRAFRREEPDAGNPHVRVCEGRGWQHPRLLGTPSPSGM